MCFSNLAYKTAVDDFCTFAGLAAGSTLSTGSALLEVESIPAGDRDGIFSTFRLDAPTNVPVFSIDNQVWMSLTPLEVQSHVVPISLASGRVAAAGLGLGYAAIQMARKDTVAHVDVFETNADVIAVFEKLRQSLPAASQAAASKIHVKQLDIRHHWVECLEKSVAKPAYDFGYIDIYATLYDDRALEDLYFAAVSKFATLNWFWGEERYFAEAAETASYAELLSSSSSPKLNQLTSAALDYYAAWKAETSQPLEKLLAPTEVGHLLKLASRSDTATKDRRNASFKR